jgi:hypothetical protein
MQRQAAKNAKNANFTNIQNMQNMFFLHIQVQMSEDCNNVYTWVDNLTLLPVLSMS